MRIVVHVGCAAAAFVESAMLMRMDSGKEVTQCREEQQASYHPAFHKGHFREKLINSSL